MEGGREGERREDSDSGMGERVRVRIVERREDGDGGWVRG